MGGALTQQRFVSDHHEACAQVAACLAGERGYLALLAIGWGAFQAGAQVEHGDHAAAQVHDAFEVAQHGGGWVEYRITNPMTGEVAEKTTFVRPINQNMVLGCGIYKGLNTQRMASSDDEDEG